MSLQIGAARIDITPPLGLPMIGFAGRDPAQEIHDPLRATALAVADADERHLLISLDLLQLSAATIDRCRRSIAAATGLADAQITMACTHNHYGPAVKEDGVEAVLAYREVLIKHLAQVAREAIAALRTCRIGVGWGHSDIAINRRELRDGRIVLGNNPEGPVDHRLGVARIDDDAGHPMVSLLSYACHPVSQRGRMAHISADYPGRATAVVEELTGATCLFLQGACGDINPVRMEDSYEPARSMGVRLGCEAVRVWETIETAAAKGVAAQAQTLDLPAYRYGDREAATALVAELEADIAARERDGDTDSGPMWWAQHRLDRVRQALDSWKSGTSLPTVAAEVSALRIGPLGLATAPGEIFTESGQHITAESPHEHTFFLGYTNGSIGYVPTRTAYAAGGYEVTHACRVDPDAGEMISDSCVELLSAVAAGQ